MTDYLSRLALRSVQPRPSVWPRLPSLFEPTAVEVVDLLPLAADQPASSAPAPQLESAAAAHPAALVGRAVPLPPGVSDAAHAGPGAAPLRSASIPSVEARQPRAIVDHPRAAGSAPVNEVPEVPERPESPPIVAEASPGTPASAGTRRRREAVLAITERPVAADVDPPVANLPVGARPADSLPLESQPEDVQRSYRILPDVLQGTAAPRPAPTGPRHVALLPATPPRMPPAVRRATPVETAAPTVQVTINRIEVRATPPPTPVGAPKAPPRSALGLDDYLRQRAQGTRGE